MGYWYNHDSLELHDDGDTGEMTWHDGDTGEIPWHISFKRSVYYIFADITFSSPTDKILEGISKL